MNSTQKDIKKREIECQKVHNKLNELHRLLLGLNAFGSLELTDYNLIMDYLKGSFKFTPIDNDKE
jgi:hypothetical protein